MTVSGHPRIVIVGGGFAGLAAARELAGKPVDVSLIDRKNHHVFQPLLYQVATALLSPADITAPLRSVLRDASNVRVVLGDVAAVDLDRQEVTLHTGGPVAFDYLLVATGSRHSYFGHDEWEPVAPGLKTMEDALELRRRILLAFEMAERTQDPPEREAFLTFVIVGGGPTGVELAGTLGEIARRTLRGEFRSIDPTLAKVVLVEAGPRVLATFPSDLSRAAVRALNQLGVEVRVATRVTEVTAAGVRLDGEWLPARVVLWAAGNAASPLGRTLAVELDRSGRVPVGPDLALPDHPTVFVAGDLCLFTHRTGAALPGTSPVAKQQGIAAARNILRRIDGRPPLPFRYHHLGTPAAIGRGHAVIDFGWVHLTGALGWLAWLISHIYYLIGFGNRLLVILQWAFWYITYKRGARIIYGPPDWPKEPRNS